MVALLFKGFLIGISIAAPVGPIGVLCIQRTLNNGLWAGLLSGLGAALADAVYGCIAGFGLAAISQYLLAQKMWIHLIGGIFLIYLGLKTIVARPHTHSLTEKPQTYWQDITSTFFLTLTNPMTILSFLAVFASLGVADHAGDYSEAFLIVLGVFLGSLLWWCMLANGINLIRHSLSERILKTINYFSGLLLCAFGAWAIFHPFLK